YGADIGRYHESDPLGLLGVSNSYLYASGDPVRFVDALGLYQCDYAISTHRMVCVPNESKHPPFSSSEFVSGNNSDPTCSDCQNNQNRAAVKNHGPIPIGSYTIGPRRPSSSRRDLTPSPGNTMFGRTAFQIHGCRYPASCSEGCIAATTNQIRDEINRIL